MAIYFVVFFNLDHSRDDLGLDAGEIFASSSQQKKSLKGYKSA